MDAVSIHRVGSWALMRRIPLLPRLAEIAIFLLFNSVIPASAQLGADTRLGYRGIGVVVHSRAVVGENVLIGPSVTIGGRSRSEGVPIIGDDVYVGAGARILGDIVVGSGSVIGANAVVIHDVPPRSVVAGVPARVVRMDVDVHDYADLPRDLRRAK